MKKTSLTLSILLILLAGCNKATEDFTLVCAGAIYDTFYTFKSSEVVIKAKVNRLGLVMNKKRKEMFPEEYNPVLDLKDRDEVVPIIESTEGFIKFGLPKRNNAEITYFLNRAKLTVTTTSALYNSDGSLTVFKGPPNDMNNPNVLIENCMKPST